MKSALRISCQDLGFDDERFVAGMSLQDLVDDAEQKLREQGIDIDSPECDQLLENAIRSAVKQSSRPAGYRSDGLSRAIKSVTSDRDSKSTDLK